MIANFVASVISLTTLGSEDHFRFFLPNVSLALSSKAIIVLIASHDYNSASSKCFATTFSAEPST